MHTANRHYIIFKASEINTIDFSQVVEDSASTVRRNLAGTHALVKYDGEVPSSIVSLTTKSQEYEYSEIMDLLSGDEWETYDEIDDI